MCCRRTRGGKHWPTPGIPSTLCISLASSTLLFRFIDHYSFACQVMIFVIGASTASFYGWLPLYLPELFPTRVRATAQGLSFNFGRVFAALGALGSGQLVAFYEGDYARMAATISLVYTLGLLAICFAPETKGKTLPA